jgi:hypothetical protein
VLKLRFAFQVKLWAAIGRRTLKPVKLLVRFLALRSIGRISLCIPALERSPLVAFERSNSDFRAMSAIFSSYLTAITFTRVQVQMTAKMITSCRAETQTGSLQIAMSQSICSKSICCFVSNAILKQVVRSSDRIKPATPKESPNYLLHRFSVVKQPTRRTTFKLTANLFQNTFVEETDSSFS